MGVNEILELISTLSLEERAQVKALLDVLPSAPVSEPEPESKQEPLMTEAEFAEYLAAKGVIAPLNRTAGEDEGNEDDDDDWQPIEVAGEPLSQMIIWERH